MKKTFPKRSQRVICFGGGSVMPKVVLEGLKKYPLNISTTASMLESGGSAGQLRVDFQTLPWGDLRRHLLALSDAPEWKKKIFQLRIGRETFDDGHTGHSFGNIFLAGLEHILKDLEKTLKIAHQFLKVKGHVIPITEEFAHIYAILENGETIFGEDEIDVPKKHNSNLKIKELRLSRRINAYPPVLRAIRRADLIIIGPGDLYSSLIPCFLPEGITKAVKDSKAKKIYICNLLRKRGETNDFTTLDFVKEIEKYLGTSLDFIIYNTKTPSVKRLAAHKKQHPELLGLVKIDPSIRSGQDKKKFIGENLLASSGPIIHDPKKVVKILLKLCRQ